MSLFAHMLQHGSGRQLRAVRHRPQRAAAVQDQGQRICEGLRGGVDRQYCQLTGARLPEAVFDVVAHRGWPGASCGGAAPATRGRPSQSTVTVDSLRRSLIAPNMSGRFIEAKTVAPVSRHGSHSQVRSAVCRELGAHRPFVNKHRVVGPP